MMRDPDQLRPLVVRRSAVCRLTRPRSVVGRIEPTSGFALVVTLLAIALLSVVGASLVLATNTDLLIASNAGASMATFYAADGALERTIAELVRAPDFTLVLNGSLTSTFTDGPPSGARRLNDGSALQLDTVVNLANCARVTTCAEADLSATGRDRPWGPHNPRWRLFSYGPLRPATGHSAPDLAVYAITMLADDPADTDDDAERDGGGVGSGANPGAGILWVRAEGFGPRGAHRVVQALVVRRDLSRRAVWEAADEATRGPAPSGLPLLQVLSWEELR
jgi:hypothetical protein